MNLKLTLRLDEYLETRRSFGFDLGTSARVLRRFAKFADDENASHVTVDLFLRWKHHFGTANNNTWAARLGMVRGFARWLEMIDPRTEVPPPGLISGKFRRACPYIYSPEEISQIVSNAARLPSAYGLRGLTFATILGLIAVSGLRIDEAMKLDDAHDVRHPGDERRSADPPSSLSTLTPNHRCHQNQRAGVGEPCPWPSKNVPKVAFRRLSEQSTRLTSSRSVKTHCRVVH